MLHRLRAWLEQSTPVEPGLELNVRRLELSPELQEAQRLALQARARELDEVGAKYGDEAREALAELDDVDTRLCQHLALYGEPLPRADLERLVELRARLIALMRDRGQALEPLRVDLDLRHLGAGVTIDGVLEAITAEAEADRPRPTSVTVTIAGAEAIDREAWCRSGMEEREPTPVLELWGCILDRGLDL